MKKSVAIILVLIGFVFASGLAYGQISLKTQLVETDIYENWPDSARNLRTASRTSEGINLTEVLTANVRGVTSEEKLWLLMRHEVLDDKLFDILEQCLTRIQGVRHPDTAAVVSTIQAAALGTMPNAETIKTLRLNAKRPFPKDFSVRTERADNVLALASYWALLAVEEKMRNRPHRSAAYAMNVVNLMALRANAVDEETEFQWVFQIIKSYYQDDGLLQRQ